MVSRKIAAALLTWAIALCAVPDPAAPRVNGCGQAGAETQGLRRADLRGDVSLDMRKRIASVLEQITATEVDAEDVQVRSTPPNTSAVGVVLWEDAEQLWLDSTYCENDPGKKQVHVFDKPYRKGSPREERCSDGGSPYVKVKVTKDRE